MRCGIGQFTPAPNMPVRKTKKSARNIELEIRDSSGDEDETADAENLEDKV